MSTPRIHLPDEVIKGGAYMLTNPIYIPLAGAPGVTGLQGPAGATGIYVPSGVPGATGIQGIQGLQGTTGTQGDTGLTGPTGIKGVTGMIGQTGIQGPSGPVGPGGTQGPTGIQGVTGLRGIQGIQGATGLYGPTGIQGSTGIQGLQGVKGSTGILGPAGVTGLSISGATGLGGGPSVSDDNYVPVSNGSDFVNSNIWYDGTTVGLDMTTGNPLWDSNAAVIVYTSKTSGSIIQTYDDDPFVQYNNALVFRQNWLDNTCSDFILPDAYGLVTSNSQGTSRAGGLKILGKSNNAQYASVRITGISDPDHSVSDAIVRIDAEDQSGTSVGPVASDTTMLSVTNDSISKFAVNGAGKIFTAGHTSGMLAVNSSGEVYTTAMGATLNDASYVPYSDGTVFQNTVIWTDGTGIGIDASHGDAWLGDCKMVVRQGGNQGAVMDTYDMAEWGNTNNAIRFRQASLNHGMTGYLPKDAYGYVGPISGGTTQAGGLKILGHVDDNNYASMQLQAFSKEGSTYNSPVFIIDVAEQDGIYANTLPSDATHTSFNNYGDPLVTLNGAGKLKLDKYSKGLMTVSATGDIITQDATVTLTSLPPVFANNTAAAAVLPVRSLYRTGADPDVLCIVH